MLIHHFYPRTQNIGDHFVQRGISAMIRRLVPDATFQLFDVNSRGRDKSAYGLTQSAIERANDEADLVIVGGSNLYEGGFVQRGLLEHLTIILGHRTTFNQLYLLMDWSASDVSFLPQHYTPLSAFLCVLSVSAVQFPLFRHITPFSPHPFLYLSHIGRHYTAYNH